MSDMFNSLYDEIFLNKEDITLDNDKVDDITKKYIASNANTEDKKFFLRLRKEYLRIKLIKDYNSLQAKLYNNKTRSEIISFEVARIMNNSSLDFYVSEQITNINKLLEMNSNVVSDKLYEKIVNSLIKIEISLDMRIGLFNELCNLFENELQKVEENLITGNTSYVKRRINGE